MLGRQKAGMLGCLNLSSFLASKPPSRIDAES
jgi:hypothetical protein